MRRNDTNANTENDDSGNNNDNDFISRVTKINIYIDHNKKISN